MSQSIVRYQDRSSKYRISLDLGSDSTVAYVSAPHENRCQQIDLQYFLKALASMPDLLKDAHERPSHRLKSRYGVNALYQTEHSIRVREHPKYGYTESLPKEHPTLRLIDFDGYIANYAESGSKVGYAREPNRSFFKFIDDISVPFPFDALLPNAKLIFQSGIGLDRQYAVKTPEGPKMVKIHPVEMIKNQVCLILENFIRPHPYLRNERHEMPDWRDCAVVLTVPNTYSPFHREVLADAVSKELGCEVTTITESDAIVFYYIAKVQPDEGLEMDQLLSMQQKYLTIDVGKGTTDLTLMTVTYRDAAETEKLSRGLEATRKAPMKHVFVSARTGRASGGAKVTFLVAEFFERLLDYKLRRTLSELEGLTPEEREKLRSVTGSSLRLTTKSKVQIREIQSRRLLEFERVCDWYKRGIDLVNGQIEMPDYAGEERIEDLAGYIVQILTDDIASRLKVLLTDEHQAQLRMGVQQVLLQPNTLRKKVEVPQKGKVAVPAGGPPEAEAEAPNRDHTAAQPIWDDLAREIQAYVKENVDEVLIELANAHTDGNDGTPEYDDAITALHSMLGSSAVPGGPALMRPTHIRTHVILAGQASQFKPLKRYLQEVVKKADLGTLYTQDQLLGVASQANKELAKPKEAPKKGLLKRALDFAFDRGEGVLPSPTDHLAVELTGSNLKDGCALGALDWYISNPVMQNPHAVHGQIVVRSQSGATMKSADVNMDELNSTGKVTLKPEVYDAWNIYYLPSRGHRTDNLRGQRQSIMGTLMACNEIVIQIRPPEDQSSELIVSTNTGQKIKLNDAVYGMEGAKDLREMLWPAMLLDE